MAKHCSHGCSLQYDGKEATIACLADEGSKDLSNRKDAAGSDGSTTEQELTFGRNCASDTSVCAEKEFFKCSLDRQNVSGICGGWETSDMESQCAQLEIDLVPGYRALHNFCLYEKMQSAPIHTWQKITVVHLLLL